MNEEDDLASASHFPRPVIRLGLTLVLGLLGTWLMPVQDSFAFGVLAGHHGLALLAWLTAAFAGVILLHRVEHVQAAVRPIIGKPNCDAPIHHIHGQNDCVLPVANTTPDAVVAGAAHALSMSHPVEVNTFLKETMKHYTSRCSLSPGRP